MEGDHYDRGADVNLLSENVKLKKLKNVQMRNDIGTGDLSISAPGIIATA